MSEMIKDPVKVGAVFGNARIKPKWFIWGTRRVDIAEINYSWKTKEGRDIIYNFAVSDGRNVFELAYNAAKSRWELLTVEPG